MLGGLLIAAGNFGLMLPALGAFVGSLLLMAIGTGFLKTSCTTVVGFLYGEHDIRRDSGFTLYYVGINIGAGIAPLILGYIGQTIDYRYAFGVAGVFMLAGLIQFQITRKYLGEAGRLPAKSTPQDRRILGLGSGVLAAALVVLLLMRPALEKVADGFGGLLVIAVVVTFGALILSKDFTPVEKKRIYVILVLFVASAIFWSIFEQAGSTLNLFADRSTDNHLFGFAFPSSWFQSLNSGFIYVLGPLLAWLWIRLGDRDPSLVTKFAFGSAGRGRRIPGDGVRRAGSRRHRPGQPAVAGVGLSDPHGRRAVPEPGGLERDHQARSGADRRTHHGRLVPFDLGRELLRGPHGVVLRIDAARQAGRVCGRHWVSPWVWCCC